MIVGHAVKKNRKNRNMVMMIGQKTLEENMKKEILQVYNSNHSAGLKALQKDENAFEINETKFRTDPEEEADPVNYYGFGMVSYFHLISGMIILFLALTVVHLPVMKIYSNYSNFDNDHDTEHPAIFKTLSMGNMGFS